MVARAATDLVAVTAYHAEASNPWSIGIEMVQGRAGSLYQATIDATARLIAAICATIGIPEQMPRGPYGRGDPGDAIWTGLATLGFEGVDYDGGEDLELGRRRQAALNARGERLEVDGLVGPASLAAAKRQGFARWRDVPAP